MTRKLSALFIVVISTFISAHSVAEPLLASVAIEPDAVVTTDRVVVTVHGSYTCGPLPPSEPFGSNFAFIDGQVRQASGRNITQGSFFVSAPLCDGLPQSFQASAPASLIPWHGGLGRAQATISVQRCDEFYNCENSSASTDVQIKITGGRQ